MQLRPAFIKQMQLVLISNELFLTGACIEDWNINSATNLKDVVCEHVYLKEDSQERRPHDGSFQSGEFTQRFQNFLETVDLFFVDGVDWKAFSYIISGFGNLNMAKITLAFKELSVKDKAALRSVWQYHPK